MRLVNIHSLKLEEFNDPQDVPAYVAASHKWSPDETTFKDVDKKKNTNTIGYRKLEGFCEFLKGIKSEQPSGLRASNLLGNCRDCDWLWIDTACIKKTDSAELSEAINSMFQWYANCQMCYAYLPDVRSVRDRTEAEMDFVRSKWFQRGWTLQELLAPRIVLFLTTEWEVLGHKCAMTACNAACTGMGDNLNHRISQVTGIPLRALYRHATPTDWVASFSSDEKKSWLRNRQTTKPEDRAYCLLGLCGVHMAPLYGEGANAWVRLEEEILKLETRIRSLPRGKTEQASQLDQSGQPPSTRPKRKYSDGDVTKPEARKSDHHAGHRKKQHRRTTVDGPPYTSRQLGELNLVLNKTFTVRAKESRSRYDDGLVLLIGWQSDSAARPYVSRLGKVMKTHFGYGVQHTWLPEEGAKRVMDDTMRNFTSRLLPERSLRIIHYETHTTCGDSLLRFEGLAKPDAWQSAVFDDFKEDISRCQTDILVTTNSTSATSALSSMGPSHGRRLELLSGASSSTSTADTDIYSQEFTPNICEVLKLYAEEKPKVELTTSMMHRRLYMLPPSISKVVLLSFTGQERGAITLQPLPKETQVSTPPPQETTAAVTLEVSMRLGSASQIDVKTMNELARAMQELPHIESFRFNHMYAPKVELENFMLSVTQAMKMRPLVTRLRKRIEAKRRLQAGHAVESETSSAPVTPISLPPPRDTSNPYNWNETRIAEESEESTSEEDDQIEEDSRNE